MIFVKFYDTENQQWSKASETVAIKAWGVTYVCVYTLIYILNNTK